ncbi:MAG: ethanolamine ammonia-lyase reactivating factor EutA [Proteobacteria bacterium]|nr:ethanolamine ammonia-lyase reactivating factor EutA [Pseudomonadota bacterium]
MADGDRTKRVGPHGLADHLYGHDLGHEHDGDFHSDHDHDYIDDGPLEENPLWLQDHVTLTSVGIDIGSSGTQVIFSTIKLRRLGEDLTSRYYVTARETKYLSPVSLTPYQSETRIDDVALSAIIEDAYAKAGLKPADIDTGTVILTGEALRRENAEAITSMLAEKGGEFVCAAAGHHMESMLAAYGSGIARVSQEHDSRLLNIDIGGGTTKLALVEHGRVIATAVVHIGGRLQVVDESGRIVRLDPAGRIHAARAGLDWKLGDQTNEAELDKVADMMADTLIAALTVRPLPADIEDLYLTDPIDDFGNLGGIMFSGGVGEYVYRRESRDFRDMGKRLGTAIRRKLAAGALAWPLLPAGECIRATALGASEYSVQLSGNTCFISDPGVLLPRRNLQVLQPPYTFAGEVDADEVAKAIRAHRRIFETEHPGGDIALAFHWAGTPSFERIHAFAKGIAQGLGDKVAAHKPIYIMLDGDIAQTLGAILREDCQVASEILVIDGVMLMDFDYIDLGRIRVPSYTVPVTIKSLIFQEDPRKPDGRAHVHARDHGHGRDHHHHSHEREDNHANRER